MSRIVVIEEDRLMRELLVEWLSARGHDVRVTARGGVPLVTHGADLVIVDLYMPRHDGSSRLRAVKTAYPGSAVIAMSAQFTPAVVGSCAAARALGVQQVIAKPCSRRVLEAAVDEALGSAA